MNAEEICRRAAELVGGDRAAQHGPKLENHRNIADLWNAYLGSQLGSPIGPAQAALMVALLKIARTKTGSRNPDDYVDLAGYAGVAGEIVGEMDKGWASSEFTAGAAGSMSDQAPRPILGVSSLD